MMAGGCGAGTVQQCRGHSEDGPSLRFEAGEIVRNHAMADDRRRAAEKA